MYKNLAFTNGILLAVMIFCNGLLSGITGPYLSTLIFHMVGLILMLAIAAVNKTRFSALKEIPLLFFLPGILSLITILLNNLCVPRIGISLTIGVSLYGQLVMSALVEHYGLFGMPVNKFRKEKILGFSSISLGIALMIVM